MIELKQKFECCGCGVCEAICPQKCIILKPDSEGFLYPDINKETCVNCRLCNNVCPILNKQKHESIIDAYVFQHMTDEVRFDSASGGFFSAVAQYSLARGGVVYGVILDRNKDIVHVRGNDENTLSKMRGSKYVQSNMNGIYKQIKEDLDNGTGCVLFSGTPCQIEALKNFLRKEYENLITVAVVCHGVASPKIWKKYVSYLERKFEGNIVFYSFRNKKEGYHKNGTQITFSDGRKIFFNDDSSQRDFMRTAYFSEIISRPSCHHCQFKKRERSSDFTVFDCWSLKNVASEWEDDKGASNVFIHTAKGRKVFNEIKEQGRYKAVDPEAMIESDGINVLYSMLPNKKREEFFYYLDKMEMDELQDKFLKPVKKSFFYRCIKKVLVKLNVIKLARKIKFTIGIRRC